jgi:hypothetical protein
VVEGKSIRGEPLGLRLSIGDLEEVHVEGELVGRGDNDHPIMALLSERADPGARVSVAVRAFPGSGGGEVKLSEAALTRVDPARAREPFPIRVDAARSMGPLPRPFSGLSQGGGMSDTEEATARKLREAGVRWFRMDNVLTGAVRSVRDGRPEYDWTDLDRRVDFIAACGADAILCLSYMPQPLEAFSNKDRHAIPRDYGQWEELCRAAAERCRERGRRVRYWEVWNESNSGWLDPGPGKDRLDEYLKLYEASVRGVRRADPEALVGGPASASGPWDRSAERPYAADGRRFLRGLLERCQAKGLPLDFVSWHEYFQPPDIFQAEVAETRKLLEEFPGAARGVKELLITEWNFAWWPDPAQDCELGAAWCADIALRVFIPLGVDKPCFFYVKDGDESFRGSYAMIQGPRNRPKAAFNVMKQFSLLAPERIACQAAADGEVSVVASRDPATGRVTVLLVDYAQRWGIPRRVDLSLEGLASTVRRGVVRMRLVDALHANAWNDPGRAELERVEVRRLEGESSQRIALRLLPASVALIEIEPVEP